MAAACFPSVDLDVVFHFLSRETTTGNLDGVPVRPNTFWGNRLRRRARLTSTWRNRLFSAPNLRRRSSVEGMSLRNFFWDPDLDRLPPLDNTRISGQTRAVVVPA